MARGSSGTGAPSANKTSANARASAHAQSGAKQAANSRANSRVPVSGHHGVVPITTQGNHAQKWAQHNAYRNNAR